LFFHTHLQSDKPINFKPSLTEHFLGKMNPNFCSEFRNCDPYSKHSLQNVFLEHDVARIGIFFSIFSALSLCFVTMLCYNALYSRINVVFVILSFILTYYLCLWMIIVLFKIISQNMMGSNMIFVISLIDARLNLLNIIIGNFVFLLFINLIRKFLF